MASVYNRLIRYYTPRPAHGRKPILEEEHVSIVRAAVQQERQRLSQARQIVEENTCKRMSNETLTRFLKIITAVNKPIGKRAKGGCNKAFCDYKLQELHLISLLRNNTYFKCNRQKFIYQF